MKIGIFGGSFDPVHTEHVCMAVSAIESLGLDKLLVVPASSPPHKPHKKMTADDVRIRTLELAFAGQKKVEVSRYEIDKKGTSYTYLTCRHFKECYPDAELYFLVGTDMLRDFPSWREPQDILRNACLAVCGRAEDMGWEEKEQEDFQRLFGQCFIRVAYEGKDVSSTKIRVLLSAGLPTQGMLDERVEAYLKENKIYEIPHANEALSLLPLKRRDHTLRVAELAAARAPSLGIDERRAITASLFHDCAKYLDVNSPLLAGFLLQESVPAPVVHQFSGAYLAKNAFGIEDKEVLDAIRYHTSGRPQMTTLEKLIYLADALEAGREYDGVETLRSLFWKKDGLDECLRQSLKSTLTHVEKGGQIPYHLTKEAYEYYQTQTEKNHGGNQ